MELRWALLDVAADDEAAMRQRLDDEVPGLLMAGADLVVLDLGGRARVHRGTSDAIALAHRELHAAGSQMAVVGTASAAADCSRRCTELLVAATVRQALAAVGCIDAAATDESSRLRFASRLLPPAGFRG